MTNPPPGPDGPPSESDPTDQPAWSAASATILRHAALLGDDSAAFLPALRRGEAVDSASAQELIRALNVLEVEHRGAARIDRKLAYALHRLAFEGQVLLTDSWPGAAVDEATVDVLRIVQEAVDRVLSGEDIRYFAPDSGPEKQL